MSTHATVYQYSILWFIIFKASFSFTEILGRRREKKWCEQFFIHFFCLTNIKHINWSLLLFCLLFCIMCCWLQSFVVQTGCAIAKFPKFKDHFLPFDLFFYNLGKNKVGGSVKLKIKFLSPNVQYVIIEEVWRSTVSVELLLGVPQTLPSLIGLTCWTLCIESDV